MLKAETVNKGGGRTLSVREYSEPIPGVLLPPGVDTAAELRRLFPRSHYPELWDKYPHAFGKTA